MPIAKRTEVVRKIKGMNTKWLARPGDFGSPTLSPVGHVCLSGSNDEGHVRCASDATNEKDFVFWRRSATVPSLSLHQHRLRQWQRFSPGPRDRCTCEVSSDQRGFQDCKQWLNLCFAADELQALDGCCNSARSHAGAVLRDPVITSCR